jgi:AcrR family transcriptional regulator
MSTRQEAVAEPGRGREAQRRRTRQAIVDATQVLLREGRTPSVDDVAAAAEVSRRTVYLYFPTLDQLLLDAAVGLMSSEGVDAALDAVPPTGDAEDDARERVDVLVRGLLGQAEESLPLGRRIIRLTVESPPEPGAARRGYRRVEWIERALEPLRDRLSPEQFDRLASALALVVGWEAMTVLRDVRGLDADQEAAVLTWAARALVDAMLDEAAGGPG